MLDRVRFLFSEFCLWRQRVNEGYRHSYCDEWSNRIAQEIERCGYLIFSSGNPLLDKYYYALMDEHEKVITTDTELGFNLTTEQHAGVGCKVRYRGNVLRTAAYRTYKENEDAVFFALRALNRWENIAVDKMKDIVLENDGTIQRYTERG